MSATKRHATKAISLTGRMVAIEKEKAMEKNTLVVINERWGYNEKTFEANVAREDLFEIIERELKAIGAKYPLTYAHDLPVFLEDEDQISYRIDTEDENDSHQITISKLEAFEEIEYREPMGDSFS